MRRKDCQWVADNANRKVQTEWMRVVRDLMLCGFVCLFSVGCTINEKGLSWTKPKNLKTKVVVDPKVTSHEYRCLVLHDPSSDVKLTSTQMRMLYGKETRDFMKANCVKDAKGRESYKILDGTPEGLKDVTGVWKEMIDRNPPKSLPWVIHENGPSKPIAKPLPTDWAEWSSDSEKMAGVN